MSSFFVHTDHSVAGPFTGIELREAAMAGIICFDAVIGGGPNGPWHRAADIGLFSVEKRTPLPHPPGTSVPTFEVRGLPGAFEGPFKLRELIGFAARGLLPVDAMLKSSDSEQWVSTQRIGILMACLNGDLVLIDAAGKVVVRSNVSFDQEGVCSPANHDGARHDGARAPREIAKKASTTYQRVAPVSTDAEQAEFQREVAAEQAAANRSSIENRPKSEKSPKPQDDMHGRSSRGRTGWPSNVSSAVRSLANPRHAARLVGFLLLFAGVASAYSYWSHVRMERSAVIGDWARTQQIDGHGTVVFAASFQEDGQLILVNSTGRSWTGTYEWSEPLTDEGGFAQSFSTTIDEVSEAHRAGPVSATDGYVTLAGFLKEAPEVEGHGVRDFFVRRSGKDLLLGYPSAVHWSPGGRTMEAGWIQLQPMNQPRGDVDAKLRAIQMEGPPPTEQYGGDSPPHVSEAVSKIDAGVPTLVGNEMVSLHQSAVYARTLTTGTLVAKLGMPDEARTIYGFEKPNLDRGPSLRGAQVIRYGNLRFMMSPEGRLRYLARVSGGIGPAAASHSLSRDTQE